MTTDTRYQYPKPEYLYPDRENKSYRLKRLRFRLRALLHQSHIKQFSQFVNQHSDLIDFLNQHPNYSYPLIHRFLDKRFNAHQRFSAICDNLCFLPEQLHRLGLPSLWQQNISFGEIIEGIELRLTFNHFQPMEGFWALELYDNSNQQLIYLLTFGKLNNALLIAVVQGPNFEGSKDVVKLLTKKCYGLRPAYLMVEAMKALTQVLGFQQLLGIPQKYQNKSRLVQSKRYVVNYDAIFAESGGVLTDYWQLPLKLDAKNLDDIPSNKRSMYRKRYAMLAQLQTTMQLTLCGQTINQ